ncbi:MAG: LexA family transcriptional regulator [Candidatus Paceibacterota bacterium]
MKDDQELAAFFTRWKRMPTYEEMKDLFGVASKNTVAYRVKKMIEAGILEKNGNKLSLVQTGSVMRLGTVQAGFPTAAEEDIASELMSLDDFLIERKQSTYMLEVRGESMKDAGIMEGDLVLVERGRTAKRGDIVLALVDNEYTLKYLETEKGKPVLVPANKAFKKIYPNPNTLRIEAVLKAVIRKYK